MRPILGAMASGSLSAANVYLAERILQLGVRQELGSQAPNEQAGALQTLVIAEVIADAFLRGQQIRTMHAKHAAIVIIRQTTGQTVRPYTIANYELVHMRHSVDFHPGIFRLARWRDQWRVSKLAVGFFLHAVNMLRPHADADQARGDPAQLRIALNQSHQQRRPGHRLCLIGDRLQHRTDHALLNQNLRALC